LQANDEGEYCDPRMKYLTKKMTYLTLDMTYLTLNMIYLTLDAYIGSIIFEIFDPEQNIKSFQTMLGVKYSFTIMLERR